MLPIKTHAILLPIEIILYIFNYLPDDDLHTLVNSQEMYYIFNNAKAIQFYRNFVNSRQYNLKIWNRKFNFQLTTDIVRDTTDSVCDTMESACAEFCSRCDESPVAYFYRYLKYYNVFKYLASKYNFQSHAMFKFDSNSLSYTHGKKSNITIYEGRELCYEVVKNLDELSCIYEINMYNKSIIKIENMFMMFNLSRLTLCNNIKKIENLYRLKNLRYLDLSNNKIKRIEGLDKLNLFELNLNNNKIRCIEGLDKLENLVELNLNNNKIKRIEGLDKLIKLFNLELIGNKIKRIEGLDKSESLVELKLNNNKIKRIEGLDKLKILIELNLDNNKIKRIEGLDKLFRLKCLHLNNNRIKKVKAINLFNLNRVELKNNNISHMEEDLKYLRNRSGLSIYVYT